LESEFEEVDDVDAESSWPPRFRLRFMGDDGALELPDEEEPDELMVEVRKK
jgi:hypothetical protein